jgi:hypothetical protein
MVCDELSVVMLCKWRHHPSGGGGVVSAGYTVLYVSECALVGCISHNKVSFMYSRRKLDITWCRGNGTRWSSDGFRLPIRLCGNFQSKKCPTAVRIWGGVLSYWDKFSCHQDSLFTKSDKQRTGFCTSGAIF